MQKVTFAGSEQLPEYHSFDGEQSIELHPGDIGNLSDAKAEQVLADFPDEFLAGEHEIDVERAPKEPSSEVYPPDPPADPAAPPADPSADPASDLVDVEALKAELGELKVAPLLERAKDAGVPDEEIKALSKRGTAKAKIVDAIVAAVEAAQA